MQKYFTNEAEYAMSEGYWRKYMAENNLPELELFEAKRESGTGYFYCTEFLEVTEVGTCGKVCDKYEPNNGISGRCKHYGYVYEQTEKSIVIK